MEPVIFYFDVGSPFAYLAAERMGRVLPEPVVWQRVSPTVAVGDELFWGDDRLEDAAALLAGARR